MPLAFLAVFGILSAILYHGRPVEAKFFDLHGQNPTSRMIPSSALMDFGYHVFDFVPSQALEKYTGSAPSE